MDISSLKNYLIQNSELIVLIMQDVGFVDIDDDFKNGAEIRCAWEEGGNPTGVRVSKDTLSARCYTKGIKGDLITLVQEKMSCTFREAINKITSLINYTEKEEIPIDLPFGGYFKKIKKIRNNRFADLKTYDETLLNNFLIMPSQLFYEDGISIDVQKKYQIGFDLNTNRVIVCWRSLDGNLCGIMGRLNKKEVEKGENKWYPIIPFPKSSTLFGFSENYKAIQQNSLVLIGESEKFPMALESKGVNLGIGLGGNTMSHFQANNIKSLFPKTKIIMLDEGLEEEQSVYIAEQLKVKSFYENNVGYVYDKNNLYLPTGSKMSPSDLPIEDMKRLMKHCIKWI